MSPYVTELDAAPRPASTVPTAIITDAVFVVSLFVLGGGFWDKLRALFVRTASVVFPAGALRGLSPRSRLPRLRRYSAMIRSGTAW